MTYSLWDEASRDIDAEASLRTQASAQVAARELMPFVALALTEAELEHRLALAEDSIATTAAAAGVSPADVEERLRATWALLAEAKGDLPWDKDSDGDVDADDSDAKDSTSDDGDDDSDDSDDDDKDDDSDKDDSDDDDSDDKDDDSGNPFGKSGSRLPFEGSQVTAGSVPGWENIDESHEDWMANFGSPQEFDSYQRAKAGDGAITPHTHPETYSANDYKPGGFYHSYIQEHPEDSDIYAEKRHVHKNKGDCASSWCTFDGANPATRKEHEENAARILGKTSSKTAASNRDTHTWKKGYDYCVACGMDKPEKGEWSPTCETVNDGMNGPRQANKTAINDAEMSQASSERANWEPPAAKCAECGEEAPYGHHLCDDCQADADDFAADHREAYGDDERSQRAFESDPYDRHADAMDRYRTYSLNQVRAMVREGKFDVEAQGEKANVPQPSADARAGGPAATAGPTKTDAGSVDGSIDFKPTQGTEASIHQRAVAALSNQILKDNPSLSITASLELANATADRFPAVIADFARNPLQFNAPGGSDGPLTQKAREFIEDPKGTIEDMSTPQPIKDLMSPGGGKHRAEPKPPGVPAGPAAAEGEAAAAGEAAGAGEAAAGAASLFAKIPKIPIPL